MLNYKVGTLQAKQHHYGGQVNACISLNEPSRSKTVVSPVINLHRSSANINYCLENSATAPNSYIIDSKDPKNIVCVDAGTYKATRKNLEEIKSCLCRSLMEQVPDECCHPNYASFAYVKKESELVGADNIVQVTGSGRAVTLINLSYFKPSTAFRAMNEILHLMSVPSMEGKFRSSETNKVAKNFLFIVDDGAGGQPASTLLQMPLFRM